MRQDYQTINALTFVQKKEYVLKICHDKQLENKLMTCMTHRQLLYIMNQPKINHQLYIYACQALYQVYDYDELEYHLIMMNHFFDGNKYRQIKAELLHKLCQRTITLNEYCVIRHLIDFQNETFFYIIDTLHTHYGVGSEECAKICLLENHHTLACEYLKQLDDCHNEALLNLLCSYNVYEYVSLMKHYQRKARNYLFVPSH